MALYLRTSRTDNALKVIFYIYRVSNYNLTKISLFFDVTLLFSNSLWTFTDLMRSSLFTLAWHTSVWKIMMYHSSYKAISLPPLNILMQVTLRFEPWEENVSPQFILLSITPFQRSLFVICLFSFMCLYLLPFVFVVVVIAVFVLIIICSLLSTMFKKDWPLGKIAMLCVMRRGK